MSGSQRCKHAWLAGREVVVSASVRRRVFLGLSGLSVSMEIGSLYGLRLKPQFRGRRVRFFCQKSSTLSIYAAVHRVKYKLALCFKYKFMWTSGVAKLHAAVLAGDL